MDGIRAQKLRNSLLLISQRTLRDSHISIQLYSSKLGRVFGDLDNLLKLRKRDAYQKWGNFINQVKTGIILDSLRAQKLKERLAFIPLRTIKDA